MRPDVWTYCAASMRDHTISLLGYHHQAKTAMCSVVMVPHEEAANNTTISPAIRLTFVESAYMPYMRAKRRWKEFVYIVVQRSNMCTACTYVQWM